MITYMVVFDNLTGFILLIRCSGPNNWMTNRKMYIVKTYGKKTGILCLRLQIIKKILSNFFMIKKLDFHEGSFFSYI